MRRAKYIGKLINKEVGLPCILKPGLNIAHTSLNSNNHTNLRPIFYFHRHSLDGAMRAQYRINQSVCLLSFSDLVNEPISFSFENKKLFSSCQSTLQSERTKRRSCIITELQHRLSRLRKYHNGHTGPNGANATAPGSLTTPLQPLQYARVITIGKFVVLPHIQ